MITKSRSGWILYGGLVCLVLGLAGHGIPAKSTSPPLRVFFANAGGGVLFSHARHAEVAGTCADCHHERAAGESGSCVACHHPGSFEVTEWEDPDMAAVHDEMVAADDAAACVGCHEHDSLIQPLRPASQASCAQCHDADLAALRRGHRCSACHSGDEEAPIRACRSCHQSGEGEARTCERCHEGSDYTAEMLPHAELAAVEGHSCDACHVAPRGADAIHHDCNRCHLDLEKGTYFTRSREDAASVCRTCHMRQ